LIAGGLPCCVGLPLTPANIRPPITGCAGVPPDVSMLAGIVTPTGLAAARSNPTVKLLLTSRMPSSCSSRRP
jgi:hypothetical protein